MRPDDVNVNQPRSGPNCGCMFILAVVLVLVLVAVVAWFLFTHPSPVQTVGSASPTPVANTGDPAGMLKPTPVNNTYHGCPPVGDGGDPVLNTLKNRIDEPQTWNTTTVSQVLALTWPKAIEQRPHSSWSEADRQAIATYEGAPLQVEGYLALVRKQGPETCNCHSVTDVDYHMWVVDDPNKPRTQSVVAEVSPRVKEFHTAWTSARLSQLATSKQRVRISGWLMMDPEHPDEVGKSRGTIWEIHPIMQVETQQGGQWVPLDTGTTGARSGWELPPVLTSFLEQSYASQR